MKSNFKLRLFLLAAVGLCLTAAAFAQDNKPASMPPTDAQAQNADGRPDARANLLKQLGLSPDQVRQVRRVNMERRPLMEEAQRKLRDANHALDAAIYADTVNEADVKARLVDAQTAQAEVARIRAMNELSIRRVLTPDQLTRFRTMRQRFEQVRENGMQKPIGKNNQVPVNGLQSRPALTRRAIKQNGRRP